MWIVEDFKKQKQKTKAVFLRWHEQDLGGNEEDNWPVQFGPSCIGSMSTSGYNAFFILSVHIFLFVNNFFVSFLT